MKKYSVLHIWILPEEKQTADEKESVIDVPFQTNSLFFANLKCSMLNRKNKKAAHYFEVVTNIKNQ